LQISYEPISDVVWGCLLTPPTRYATPETWDVV
jgi:hypothetical protein